MTGGSGADLLDGGIGYDTASYATATSAIYVQMSNVAANLGDAFGDTYVSIENVIGTNFDDTIILSDLNDTAWGSGGADTLIGLLGDDFLIGEAGNDTLHGDGGNDQLEGRSDDDELFGDGGNDRLDGGTGNDYLLGGTGNDTFVFKAGYGNDFVSDFEAPGTTVGDVIEISGYGITTFTALQSLMTEFGGNTFITFADGSQLTLQSTAISQLTATDFTLFQ